MTDELTSTRNPRVRAATALGRRRERRSTGRHLVEGPRAVREALAWAEVVEVFATTEQVPPVVPDDVAVHVVPEHVVAAIGDARTSQGVVAVVTTPRHPAEVLDATGLVVLLDGLSDPGNVGTVIRTADAAGADAVVVAAGSADPYGPKAVRAAVGSTYHLPVVCDLPAEEAVAVLRAAGHRILGLDAGAPRSVHALRGDDAPLTLVLGSEAHGLQVREHLDGTVAVPIAERTESLNVAAAAAVALFAASHALGRVPER